MSIVLRSPIPRPLDHGIGVRIPASQPISDETSNTRRRKPLRVLNRTASRRLASHAIASTRHKATWSKRWPKVSRFESQAGVSAWRLRRMRGLRTFRAPPCPFADLAQIVEQRDRGVIVARTRCVSVGQTNVAHGTGPAFQLPEASHASPFARMPMRHAP